MTITKGFRSIGLYYDGYQIYATPITTVLTILGYIALVVASVFAFNNIKDMQDVTVTNKLLPFDFTSWNQSIGSYLETSALRFRVQTTDYLSDEDVKNECNTFDLNLYWRANSTKKKIFASDLSNHIICDSSNSKYLEYTFNLKSDSQLFNPSLWPINFEGIIDIYLERLIDVDPKYTNSIDTLKILGRTKEFDGKSFSFVNFTSQEVPIGCL